jgi:acetylglutamate kinase
MLTPVEKARVLIEALPYLKAFDRKFVVIKVGGSTMQNMETLPAVIKDVVFLEQVGVWPILVHGGGPRISAEMAKCNLRPQFIDGRRVTDAPTLDIAQRVLIDIVSAEVVKLIEEAGGKGVPMNGRGSQFLQCKKAQMDGPDLGYVGEVTEVDVELARRICQGGVIPVVAPIGRDSAGQLFNINADSVAWFVARACNAEKLVFLSDVPGLMRNPRDPNSIISTIDAHSCRKLVEDGTISGGMVPKIQACLEALAGGVHNIHIVSGHMQHSLLLEIFTPEGIGTKINTLGAR